MDTIMSSGANPPANAPTGPRILIDAKDRTFPSLPPTSALVPEGAPTLNYAMNLLRRMDSYAPFHLQSASVRKWLRDQTAESFYEWFWDMRRVMPSAFYSDAAEERVRVTFFANWEEDVPPLICSVMTPGQVIEYEPLPQIYDEPTPPCPPDVLLPQLLPVIEPVTPQISYYSAEQAFADPRGCLAADPLLAFCECPEHLLMMIDAEEAKSELAYMWTEMRYLLVWRVAERVMMVVLCLSLKDIRPSRDEVKDFFSEAQLKSLLRMVDEFFSERRRLLPLGMF
ncbi:hypothetical protein BT63DRAFT_331566 [Microthyrium microscopicum]|uniref:Uncharacterized protein n=1 Tax=Microthyrium microscopicum TaxID=703497 RepID=A0A6A6U6V8_9PEZI|nr:hypothetical protein BT63DRAFT_331566 [Microthyrium microscopicum]